MNRSNALVALGAALCLLAAPTHGEAPERSAVKRARSKLQLNLANQPIGLGVTSSSPLLQDCPATATDWTTWRNAAIDALLAPRLGRPDPQSPPAPYLDFDQMAYQAAALSNRLDDCEAHGRSTPPADVVGNLRSMAKALQEQTGIDNQFGHGGFDAAGEALYDDRHYLETIRPLVELPCLLTQTSFLDALADRATYHQAVAWLDQRNQGQTVLGCPYEGGRWETLLYKSAVLATPDDALVYGRLLVVVPGDDRDRWIQFGIRADDDDGEAGATVQNVSIVSVPRLAAPSQPAPYTAMIDWFRVQERGPDGTIQRTLKTRFEAVGRTGNCMLCHKTPVIGIHTDEVYGIVQQRLERLSPADTEARIEHFRKWTYRYGPATQAVEPRDAYAQPERYGPPLGPNDARYDLTSTRSDEALRACAGSAQPITVERLAAIRKAMNCASCHNNHPKASLDQDQDLDLAHLGAINLPVAAQFQTATSSKDGGWPNLLYRYITKGYMPPSRTTTPKLPDPADRLALYNCLQAEYHDARSGRGLLRNWLQHQDLPPAKTEPVVAGVPPGPGAPLVLSQPPAALVAPLSLAQAGQRDFNRLCLECHGEGRKHVESQEGPSLRGVLHRQAGLASAYAEGSGASRPLREAGAQGVVWTEANLLRYLANQPQFFRDLQIGSAGDSRMKQLYADEGLRLRVVAYLKTLQ